MVSISVGQAGLTPEASSRRRSIHAHAVLTAWLRAAVVSRVEQGAPHQSFGRGARLSALSRVVHAIDREALDEIDRSQLETCVRLMYRCPDDFDDGLPIEYRSSTLDIGECLKTISDEGRSFELRWSNSWHEYATSWRDLVEGFLLIREGGTLVVHDRLPPRSEIAVANYIPGEWCGVGYQAYVDFISQQARSRGLHGRHRLWLRRHPQARRSISRERDVCRSCSSSETGAASAATPWKPSLSFRRKQVLLNLITTEEFFARERR